MVNILPNLEQLNPIYKLIESKKSFPIGFMYRKMDALDVPLSTEFTSPLSARSASKKAGEVAALVKISYSAEISVENDEIAV